MSIALGIKFVFRIVFKFRWMWHFLPLPMSFSYFLLLLHFIHCFSLIAFVTKSVVGKDFWGWNKSNRTNCMRSEFSGIFHRFQQHCHIEHDDKKVLFEVIYSNEAKKRERSGAINSFRVTNSIDRELSLFILYKYTYMDSIHWRWCKIDIAVVVGDVIVLRTKGAHHRFKGMLCIPCGPQCRNNLFQLLLIHTQCI